MKFKPPFKKGSFINDNIKMDSDLNIISVSI